MKFNRYPIQKAREAVDALTSTLSLDARLKAAGFALVLMPTDGLTDEVAAKALVAQRAFSQYSQDWPREDGTVAALIDILPDGRKRELVQKVVDLFQEVCELVSSDGPFRTKRLEEHELCPADSWEFLYWNLSSTHDADAVEGYVRYAQTWLPNFPRTAFLEWFGRHGYGSMRYWQHLPLERLTWTLERWSNAQVGTIQSIDPAFATVGPGGAGYGHIDRPGDRIGEYIHEHLTWPEPILVIDHQVPVKVAGTFVPSGWVLIDGHTRLSRLVNFPLDQRKDLFHDVLVARLPEAGDQNVVERAPTLPIDATSHN